MDYYYETIINENIIERGVFLSDIQTINMAYKEEQFDILYDTRALKVENIEVSIQRVMVYLSRMIAPWCSQLSTEPKIIVFLSDPPLLEYSYVACTGMFRFGSIEDFIIAKMMLSK